MSRVTKNVVKPTKKYRLDLQSPVYDKVKELEALLAKDSYNWDMHKEFSDAIAKVAASAISDIKQIKLAEKKQKENDESRATTQPQLPLNTASSPHLNGQEHRT